MENKVPANQASKLKPLLLAFAIIVILGGGGLAIWSVMKKEDEPEESANTEESAPVRGRVNATDLYTEEELENNPLFDKNSPDRTPEYEAVLVDSEAGKKLIEARTERIQLNGPTSDMLRAKHKVGRNLENIQALSAEGNKAVQEMFGLVEGSTAGEYLTYPIYGSHETDGVDLIKDINTFLAKDGQGYNLTPTRHDYNKTGAWWFGSVGLNLMYGSTEASIHKTSDLYWYRGGEEARKGLDFFKVVNGHDVPDRRLVDERRADGKGVFAAWGMYTVVKEWKKAIEYFDKITRQEAISALEKEGLIRRI